MKMDELTAQDTGLPVSSIRGISHDVVDRISDEAVTRIAYHQEKEIKEKVRLASIVANRAGRKTVREEDITVVEEILSSDIA